MPICRVADGAGASHSVYANEANIYSSSDQHNLEGCAALLAESAMRDLYTGNGMLLNPSKTEAMLVGTGAQLHKFKHPVVVSAASMSISCCDVLISLGVFVDSKLSFDT